jgi:hypothetical protein
MLHINSDQIAGTPVDVPPRSLERIALEPVRRVPVPSDRRGPAMISWVRRAPWDITVAWILAVCGYASGSRVVGPRVGGNVDAQVLATLLPLHLGGAIWGLNGSASSSTSCGWAVRSGVDGRVPPMSSACSERLLVLVPAGPAQ